VWGELTAPRYTRSKFFVAAQCRTQLEIFSFWTNFGENLFISFSGRKWEIFLKEETQQFYLYLLLYRFFKISSYLVSLFFILCSTFIKKLVFFSKPFNAESGWFVAELNITNYVGQAFIKCFKALLIRFIFRSFCASPSCRAQLRLALQSLGLAQKDSLLLFSFVDRSFQPDCRPERANLGPALLTTPMFAHVPVTFSFRTQSSSCENLVFTCELECLCVVR
jgi:hypothetical protein